MLILCLIVCCSSMHCINRPRMGHVISLSLTSGMPQEERNGILLCDPTSFVCLHCIIYCREAWNVCGKMSKELAMQLYVEELQQVLA